MLKTQPTKKRRVLVTPLDWGLGHATRCIPVIRELEFQGCEVVIGSSGDSLELLRREFTNASFVSLPAYAPQYPRNGSMTLRMAMQLPRFMHVISKEHRVLEDFIVKRNIDLLISDNRYGCWSDKIPSVFITHQSNIMMPKRFGFLGSFVRKQNLKLINRFQECWIPDLPSDHSLAGDLASFGEIDNSLPIKYVGWLSRFERMSDQRDKQFDVLAIFSGPEPQRTLFENVLVQQLKKSGLRYRVVRGLPSANTSEQDDHSVNFQSTTALQSSVESSDLVIARSGYSTIMDLCALGAKAVLVPTPGQTEQEYLSRRLMEKNISFSMRQDQFDLAAAIQESKNYNGFPPWPKNDLLRDAITKLIK